MRKEELTLVVLAAGLGSRFGGPKQIEAVGPSGEIILDYSVYDALAAGFSHIVFVVRDEVEAVLRPHLSAPLAGRCAVSFVTQRLDGIPAPFSVPATRVKPWGTGQAVLACRDAVTGPFAVVNADDFYGADGFRRVALFLSEGAGMATQRNALVGYSLASTLTEHGTVSRGACEVDSRGYLTSIVERHGVGTRAGAIGYEEAGSWHPLPRDAVASMNFWGFDPSIFALLDEEFRSFLAAAPADAGEFRLPTAIGNLIARHATEVHVVRTASAWLGVTHRKDLAWVRDAITTLVRSGEYPSPLWERGGRRG
jgi:UTP-glucose-1-phosphate uridylyltransferase